MEPPNPSGGADRACCVLCIMTPPFVALCVFQKTREAHSKAGLLPLLILIRRTWDRFPLVAPQVDQDRSSGGSSFPATPTYNYKVA